MTIFWLSIILLVGVCIVIIVVLVIPMFRKKKSIPTPKPEIHYIPETKYSSGILTPVGAPYLIVFTQSSGAGSRRAIKCWYRYRFVMADGSYGNFSDWTSSPVQAGADVLPYAPKLLSQPTGQQTCLFNKVMIGVPEESIPMSIAGDAKFTNIFTGKVSLNLHRYCGVNPPTDTTPDTIVGQFILPNSQDGNNYIAWEDIDDPCAAGCSGDEVNPNCS